MSILYRAISLEAHSFFARVLRALLFPLSWLYAFFVFLRNRGYDLGWFRVHHAKIPVISVGNLVMGGTGKTPMILKLFESLSSKGKIAIASRGYRAIAERLPRPTRVSDGMGPLCPPSICGDEPFLLASRAEGALVFSGRSRALSADLAEQSGASLLLLDDGMQHRALHRDFDLVLLDPERPFGNGWHFPAGVLREGKRGLSRASLLVFNPVKDKETFLRAKKKIATYSNAPVIGISSRAYAFLDDALISIENRKLGVFCGIARPWRFRETIQVLKGKEVLFSSFKDHEVPSLKKLVAFADQAKAKGADALICTEKDFLKLPSSLSLPLPLYQVRIEVDVTYGQEEWRLFLQRAREKFPSHV